MRKIISGKKILRNLVYEIKDSVRCVIVYGSTAQLTDGTFQGKPDDQSDIDFLVVFKQETSPYQISKKIEITFKKAGVRIHYAPFMEDEFLQLLSEGIDLYLWWSIFGEGENLYSDDEFLSKVSLALDAFSPKESLSKTLEYRSQRSRNYILALLRNLHRITIDAIMARYYEKRRLKSWNDLLPFKLIVDTAQRERIIPRSVADLCTRIETQAKRLEKHTSAADLTQYLEEIDKLNAMVNNLARGVLNGESVRVIDERLAVCEGRG